MGNCWWPSSAAIQSCHSVTWWNGRPSSAGCISLLSHRSKQIMPSEKSAHMFLFPPPVWSSIHRLLMQSGAAVNLTGYSACLRASTLYSEEWTSATLVYKNHILCVCVCVCGCVWCVCVCGVCVCGVCGVCDVCVVCVRARAVCGVCVRVREMSLDVNVIWPQGF